MSTKRILNTAEAQNPVWQKVEAHVREELARARRRLEGTGTSAEERTALVWQIKTLKDFIALGSDEKNVAGAGE